MKKFDSKINSWLRSQIIPQLIETLPEKCNVDDVKFTITRPKGSFYLSDLFFVNIKLPSQGKYIVVKIPPQNPKIQGLQKYDQLFQNEIFFYKYLASKNDGAYPKCYYCGADKVFRHVIVLENVCKRGFFISPRKVNVDLDYVVAGLKAIARFHGNAYTMKEQNPSEFKKILNDIVNVRFNEDSEESKYAEMIDYRMQRYVKMLHRRSDDYEFVEKITKLFDRCFENVLMKCVKPIEPLATVIHGDFTINNILFRKLNNDKAGSLEATLLDFTMLIYASPSLDIATYIYMSCTRADIRDYSKDLLKAYHDTLTDYMKETGIWNPTKYSFDAFLNDYRERAIFGYVIAAHFRSIMTAYEDDNDLLDKEFSFVEEANYTGGGDTLSHYLVDMLMDMRDAGMLDYYVNNNNVG